MFRGLNPEFLTPLFKGPSNDMQWFSGDIFATRCRSHMRFSPFPLHSDKKCWLTKESSQSQGWLHRQLLIERLRITNHFNTNRTWQRSQALKGSLTKLAPVWFKKNYQSVQWLLQSCKTVGLVLLEKFTENHCLRLTVQEKLKRWKIHRLRIIFPPFEMLSWIV